VFEGGALAHKTLSWIQKCLKDVIGRVSDYDEIARRLLEEIKAYVYEISDEDETSGNHIDVTDMKEFSKSLEQEFEHAFDRAVTSILERKCPKSTFSRPRLNSTLPFISAKPSTIEARPKLRLPSSEVVEAECFEVGGFKVGAALHFVSIPRAADIVDEFLSAAVLDVCWNNGQSFQPLRSQLGRDLVIRFMISCRIAECLMTELQKDKTTEESESILADHLKFNTDIFRDFKVNTVVELLNKIKTRIEFNAEKEETSNATEGSDIHKKKNKICLRIFREVLDAWMWDGLMNPNGEWDRVKGRYLDKRTCEYAREMTRFESTFGMLEKCAKSDKKTVVDLLQVLKPSAEFRDKLVERVETTLPRVLQNKVAGFLGNPRKI
jgi:hypothetical protein